MVNEVDRSHAADPAKALRWGHQSDARRIAAGLEPHRASDAPGRRAERLLVLIDDAGFGNPSTFGGPIQTPNYTRIAEGGVRYNRFHVTALCSPTRAALLTGRNNHAVGFGSIGEFAGGFPWLLGDAAAGLRAAAADPSRQRLQHGGVRQVAPDARRTAGSGRAVRPVAERLGLRLLLRLPRRRRQPVGSVPRREPEDHRHRRALLRRGRSVLLPRRDGRPHDRVGARRARAGRAQAVLHVLLDGLQSRAAPRRGGVGRQIQGQVRPGLGPAARGDVRRGRRSSESSLPTPNSRRATTAFPAWDDVPDKLKEFYARQMEVYAGFSENADHNVGRVINAIEELGELDNTIILWIWGDNGASMEGTSPARSTS